jgi:hypothetical protein
MSFGEDQQYREESMLVNTSVVNYLEKLKTYREGGDLRSIEDEKDGLIARLEEMDHDFARDVGAMLIQADLSTPEGEGTFREDFREAVSLELESAIDSEEFGEEGTFWG